MTIPFKKQIVEVGVVLVLIAVAFGWGRFSAPTKVKTVTVTQTQVQIQYKDKIVTEVVYKTKYVKVKDTVLAVDTTTTTTKQPNGAETTTTTTHEQLATQTTNTQATTNTSNTTNTSAENKTKDTETTTTKVVDNSRPEWMFDVTYGYNSHLFDNATNIQKPMVGGIIQKRLIGPIYLGAFGGYDFEAQDANFGLTAGLSL